MQFKTAYKKGDKYLIKIALDDGKEIWATTTLAVYNFANKNFEEDEEAGFEYTEKNGQFFVKKIIKGSKSLKKEESNASKYVCEDCGKELKDDKYTRCYQCNQKAPKDSKPSKTTYSKSPEDKEQIKRLSIFSSVCNAVLVLQGQVDVNAIGDIIEELYDRFYTKISG